MRMVHSIQTASFDSQRFAQMKIGRLLKVNRRIGHLMKQGRVEASLEISDIASKFGVTSYEIERWESGFGTLQASLFAEIVPNFSDDVQWKFQKLITELQEGSKKLRAVPETIRVLVVNFEALGSVSRIQLAA